MATSSNISNSHSPRHGHAEGASSPQPRRTGRAPAAPWTQIVLGVEPEVIVPTSSLPVDTGVEPEMAARGVEECESGEDGSGPGPGAGRRPVWNKLSDGEVAPVMGAKSWPALSDSARATSLRSSFDSLKGSSSDAPQGVETATGLTTPVATRQKRNGGNGSGSSNGPSPKVGHSHSSNDQQRNSLRNRNGGPHSRVDGSHNHNGGKRDNDRNFYGRDVRPQRFRQGITHLPPPLPPPQAPPPSTPFIAQPPIRPFPAAPMAFPEFPSPVYYYPPGMPFVAPIPPISPFIFPPPDPNIISKIVQQINYYFSVENLITDTYLRGYMNEHGWVPIELIAGFNKVIELTNNIQLIMDALRSSTEVEVQGALVRKRNDWERWIIRKSQAQVPSASSPQSILEAGFQSLSVEDKSSYQEDVHPNVFFSGSSSLSDFNTQFLQTSDRKEQVGGQIHSN